MRALILPIRAICPNRPKPRPTPAVEEQMKQGGSKDFYRMRAAPRFTTQGMTCCSGTVLDLSATGIRIGFAKKPTLKPGDFQQFVFGSAEQRLKLHGRVAWVRRSGLLKPGYQIGVHFVDVKPSLRKAVEQFAEHGFISEDSMKQTAVVVPQVRVQVPDLYAMLGLKPGADAVAIKAAYRQLAKETHPDMNPDPEAAERFAMITRAYQVLGDEELRPQYDERFKASRAA